VLDRFVIWMIRIDAATSTLRPRCIALNRPALRRSRLDAQRTTCQLFAVHRAQSRRRISFVPHFDESETTRTPVKPIANDLGALHVARSCECFPQISVAQRKTQIAYE
jgi:hypothetical protein